MDKGGKLLITGASGFIGRHVVEEAVKKGYDVVGFDIRDYPSDAVKIKFIKGDITDLRAVEAAMQGVDKVIHLAGITAIIEFQKDLKRSQEINVLGFNNIIDAAVRAKVKRFLYASSSAVYLDEFHEDAVIDHKKLRNQYAKTKLINEMVAHSYNDIYKLGAIGMRFFNAYGKHERHKGKYASVISQFIWNKQKGEDLIVYGDGKQNRDFIHVIDIAKISMELLQKGKHEVYNLGTGKPITYGEVAMIIDKRNTKFLPNPHQVYQNLTLADTTRLFSVIGKYEFIDTKKGIEELMEHELAEQKAKN